MPSAYPRRSCVDEVFPLVWAAFFQRRGRALLTLFSVVTAFLLFGLLDGVRIAFNPVSSSAGNFRMFTISRFSAQGLPQALAPRFASVPGVRQVTWASFIGGHFQDPGNGFPAFAVDRHFFDLYPDYAIPDEQRRAFEQTRTGAIVGERLARRFNWKVGDRIPLRDTIRTFKATGVNEWSFDIVGIFKVRSRRQQEDEDNLFARWDYLDEGSVASAHTVFMIISQIATSASQDAVAEAIDALSANSDHETTTMTEQALNQSYFRQFGDVGLMVTAIVTAVFFTLLILTGNVVAQSVRERTAQLATLKALGFPDVGVLGIVLGESVLLIGLGGIVGLSLATGAVAWILQRGSPIPVSTLGGPTWLTGALIMVLTGLVVGALPAWRALNLSIADALSER